MKFEFKRVSGGVCAAKGFSANGLNCGINPDKNKNDLCLVCSDVMCNTAAVYTQNKVKGAPIVVTKRNLEKSGGKSQAIIANSKNANTANADGEQKAERMCILAAQELDISPEQVIVASTGVIGEVLPIEPIENAVKKLKEGLSYDGNERAVNAIMTTDTVKKEFAVQFIIDGKTCTLGGMAKGSGMIHPNMATTLTFLTTDAAISSEMIQRALSDIVKVTLNRASVDGDTSTNDMVCIMASGDAGNKPVTNDDGDFEKFRHALYAIMMNLARMMARDGEGATKLIECAVRGAETDAVAEKVAKSIIGSSLIKAMIFGEDANAGRIFCALGYSDADFDISKVDIEMASDSGVVQLGKKGCVIEFSEELAARILKEEEIKILVSLGDGKGRAIAWGCDLTYDYVKINGDYRS